ncbi:bacteriohemerythrin [Clostridium thailandense]|uniref:Hemerythrin family protein n=1 Tax=Clostridium thailandense TaxID=2794346 RepID=A0A949TW19_9CLOT|nr:bacteriohemerythrin [Clostridium thailandense]MBV7274601.1 hemerythrin family protein [Clostridium thailandense]
MFQWKKEYETGIAIIDEQHQELFKIANEAYNLLKNNLIIDKYDKVLIIFDKLLDYCKYHFSAEEKYLLDIGYKKFLSHKVQHEEFIKDLKNANLKKIDTNQDEYIMEILEFFVRWISGHILATDMDYVKYERTLK